jgi:predicted ester cyclase
MTDGASSVMNDNRPMTRDEIVAFFDRRQAAIDNLDADALAAGYTADCVVSSPAGGLHTGPQAVHEVMRAFFSAFLDMKLRVERQLIDGDFVVQIVKVEGTQINEFMGLAPTGKPIRLTAAVEYEMRGGKIARERRIYDFTGMLVQVGVLKAKTA